MLQSDQRPAGGCLRLRAAAGRAIVCLVRLCLSLSPEPEPAGHQFGARFRPAFG